MHQLDDDGCPEPIREYVRNNADIEAYEHVKRGYVGEVYFAKRKKLGDDVALKFYDAQPDYDSSEEAVILKNVDHPNILKIHHLTHVPPRWACFLTPKISGGDLQHYVDNKLLSSKDALSYVTDILIGLNELHSNHKMVHRDLKPGNILLEAATNKAIIADLGAVKKIPANSLYTTDSKATWVYLAPECIRAQQYYFQSDIYQVGVILYQLLGGHFPLHNQLEWLTNSEKRKLSKCLNGLARDIMFTDFLTEKIRKGSLVNANTLPLYLDPQFKRVVNKATAVDYTKRYQSCAEFLAAIHDLQRKYPNYRQDGNQLTITHDDLREYMITEVSRNNFQLKKKLPGGDWRLQHGQTGYNNILLIARNKR